MIKYIHKLYQTLQIYISKNINKNQFKIHSKLNYLVLYIRSLCAFKLSRTKNHV